MKPYRKCVLIADCHEDVLITLERLLEDEGYETITAWTAADALMLLEKTRVDLILVNEYLPDRNVEEFIAEFQRRSIMAPCMIMQPSSPQIVDDRRFRSLGVVGVVSKHEHRQLLEAVEGFFKETKKARVAGQTAC